METTLKFPIEITSNGSPTTTNSLDLLIQNLQEIFCIPLGTDFFQGERGSRLHLLRGEQNINVLQSLAKTYVKEVFLQSEVSEFADFADCEVILDFDKVWVKVFFIAKQTGDVAGLTIAV
jgi:hypothetical protein